MSQFNTITKYNTYLSDKLKKVTLNEYFKEIHSKFYSNINISFMDYFLELCNNENEFIVEHIKLQEYKVINNIDTSKDIKKGLDRLFLIENEDYQVYTYNVPNRMKNCNVIKKEYKLTPYAFKLCLIRAKNTKKYAKYFIFAEQVFKHYQEYQIMYQTVLMSGKDEKLDEQFKTINEMKQTIDKQSEENKKQSKQIEELLGYAKKTNEQNKHLSDTVNNLNDSVDDMKDDINDLKDNIEDIKDAFKDTADRSVPNPTDDFERHEFILLQHKDLLHNFKFIRGIQKYNETKIQNKYNEYNIIKREFNANPIQLFKMFKETVKENYKLEKNKITANKNLKNKTQLKKEVEKIKFNGNDIVLQYNYTLNDLLDEIIKVNNEIYKEYESATNNCSP